MRNIPHNARVHYTLNKQIGKKDVTCHFSHIKAGNTTLTSIARKNRYTFYSSLKNLKNLFSKPMICPVSLLIPLCMPLSWNNQVEHFVYHVSTCDLAREPMELRSSASFKLTPCVLESSWGLCVHLTQSL